MSTVISVEHLSKTYRLGQIGTGTFTNDLRLWWAKLRAAQSSESARPTTAAAIIRRL